MIDFTTLKSMSIPEGVVTEIKANGVVIWRVSSTEPASHIILEVKKITATTYAGETSYPDENFILLDIYPKSGGTVNITYGNLTKTITDDGSSADPNAQQVFFGTFNGVSDSVTTPDSGTLTIDGGFNGFAVGAYAKDAKSNSSVYCGCITGVQHLGNIEKIYENAFKNCSDLESIDIPESVHTIGDYNVMFPSNTGVFSGCTRLRNIDLTKNLKVIGDYSFYNSGLESIIIPKNITTVGDKAFGLCLSLTKCTIHSTVRDGGFNAGISGKTFNGSCRLEEFIVNEGNAAFSSEGAILFNANKTELISYPTASGSYVVPSSVTKIGKYAFQEQIVGGLTSITLPENLTKIEDYAFYNTALQSITLPKKLTTIGKYAFYGTTNLTEITIPASVTSIGSSAFGTCENVTILATTPPTLEDISAFDSAVSISVPIGCGETYKTADVWSELADKIVEVS